MAENYLNWTLGKLKREKIKIDKAIKTLESRDRKAALAQIAVVAKKNGFELHELLEDIAVKTPAGKPSSPAARKKRGKVAPKYRNPADSKQTWTGRGRQPHWIQDLVKAGGSLNDALISKS